jgi:hypothetical protein
MREFKTLQNIKKSTAINLSCDASLFGFIAACCEEREHLPAQIEQTDFPKTDYALSVS